METHIKKYYAAVCQAYELGNVETSYNAPIIDLLKAFGCQPKDMSGSRKGKAGENTDIELWREAEDLNRTRLNLEATGTETAHGQTFLQRLVALDAEIEGIGSQIETARANAAALQREFTDYLTGLNF
ncbi:MAG: hypothetical protein FWG66_14665 [Spirochaetes bacterium]|nr:hypothetical protein [Spirochaetota bacterium]